MWRLLCRHSVWSSPLGVVGGAAAHHFSPKWGAMGRGMPSAERGKRTGEWCIVELVQDSVQNGAANGSGRALAAKNLVVGQADTGLGALEPLQSAACEIQGIYRRRRR
jgi:hypothetical protein